MRSSRSPRRPALPLRPSANLAGRSVALSADIPAAFDAPLGAHHKAIGRWLIDREASRETFTRGEARKHIEQAFDQAVQEAMGNTILADLRVVVLQGDDQQMPPALAIICDSVGQIDMGWIEKTNVLSHTLTGSVAPVGWRARAYQALNVLGSVLPVFGYQEMIDELSNYYWDGETDDAEVRRVMVEFHGHDPEDVILPSAIAAKRPDFMLAENAAPLKALPVALRQRLRRLQTAFDALRNFDQPANAFGGFDFHEACEYMPEYEECSHLAPMTLVPFDDFSREVDEIGRFGMEMGFMNLTGFCPIKDATTVAQWFTSLRLGAEVIAAAQDLIDFDPTDTRARA